VRRRTAGGLSSWECFFEHGYAEVFGLRVEDGVRRRPSKRNAVFYAASKWVGGKIKLSASVCRRGRVDRGFPTGWQSGLIGTAKGFVATMHPALQKLTNLAIV